MSLIFRRHFQHVRVEIAEAGGEQQRRAVQLDHALHGLRDVVGLGNLFLLDDLDAGHLLQHRSRFGVRLVVAVIVLRPDIDEADDEFLGCSCLVYREPERGQAGGSGGALQQATA